MNLSDSTINEASEQGLPALTAVSNSYDDMVLLRKLLEIYDQGQLATKLNEIGSNHCRETVNRWVKGKAVPRLTYAEFNHLKSFLPSRPERETSFTFIDLFAGIGGIRKGFEAIGGECVFTSEWNEHAVRTYKANHFCDPDRHKFNQDIRTVTLSDQSDVSEEHAYQNIDLEIPDHDVLLAGFPCQPFSLAGVSKKKFLGQKTWF